MKKLLMTVAVLAAMAHSASADYTFVGVAAGSPDRYWSTPACWMENWVATGAAPDTNTIVFVNDTNQFSAATVNAPGAVALDIHLGEYADGELHVSRKGVLTTSGVIYSAVNGVNGKLINFGTVNVTEWFICYQGYTEVDLYDGSINAATLHMDDAGTGAFKLYGGSLNLSGGFSQLQMDGDFTFDMAGGTLNAGGNWTNDLTTLRDAGYITAYGGAPGAQVVIELNESPTETNTVMYAINGPITSAVWNDSFTNGVVNENWNQVTNTASTAISQTGGQLILDSGDTTGGAEAALHTLTDESGSVTAVNGAPLYDFYSHKVEANFDIASIAGDFNGTEGRNVFYFSIGETSVGSYFPAALANGIGVRVEHLDYLTGWRVIVTKTIAGAANDFCEGIIYGGAPVAMTVTLDGDAVSVRLQGASYKVVTPGWILSEGDSVMTGSWGEDLSTDISTYNLAYGAYNIGTPSSATVVTLDAVKVVVDGDTVVYDYARWAAEWGVDLSDKTADYEGDGLDNLQEYAFGGNPTVDDRSVYGPKLILSADAVHVYNRRISSELTYALFVDADSNLITSDWTPSANAGAVETTGPAANPRFESVTNTFTGGGALDQGFLKLDVSD